MSALGEPRSFCLACRKARVHCYCAMLTPFTSSVKFVILQHPREARNHVGTARMTYRCVQGSELIVGAEEADFAPAKRYQVLFGEAAAVLFPGPKAIDIGSASCDELEALFPAGKTPTLVVIDGTWATAKSILRKTPRLQALPQVKFAPREASRYGFRRQPGPHCVSTLEAVHSMIEAFASSGLSRFAAPEARAHDHMLELFSRMVRQQLEYSRLSSRHSAG